MIRENLNDRQESEARGNKTLPFIAQNYSSPTTTSSAGAGAEAGSAGGADTLVASRNQHKLHVVPKPHCNPSHRLIGWAGALLRMLRPWTLDSMKHVYTIP